MKESKQKCIKTCKVCLIVALFIVCALMVGCAKPEVNPPPVQEKFDPLHNKFAKSVEDWQAIDGANLLVNDKMLVIRGDNCSAKKTWTLPDKADLWVDFDYKPDGKDVSIKVEIQIADKKIVMADALPVYSDFGILNYQIPFCMYYSQAEYADKEATLTLTAVGATTQQGLRVSNVRTYTRKIAGQVEDGYNPLSNTFEKSLEDWYIGGHYSSMDYGYQLRSLIDSYYGAARIDGSQLWTREFTPNINTSMSKYLDLPQDSKQYKLNMQLKASEKGTMIMALCIVDGKVIKITDGWRYIHSEENSTLSCAIPKGGKKAQVILMQRDSNLNSGQSELCFFQHFEIVPYAMDAYDNQFIIDLEDWVDLGKGSDTEIKVADGYACMRPGSAMKKTITFTKLQDSWRQSIRMFFSTTGAARVKLDVKVDDVTTTLLNKEFTNMPLQEVALHEYDFEFSQLLSEKQGVFSLQVSGTDSNACMLLDSYKLTSKWMTNPYDNRFNDGIEDWYNISRTGWDNNCAKYDPSWHRIQIDYGPSGSGKEIGQAVFAKDYKLLNSKNIQLFFTVEGSAKNPTGYAGWFTLDLLIGDKAYALKTKEPIVGGLPVTPYTIKLDTIESLKNVDYAGKDVTLRFTFDENPADHEMVAFLDDFITTIHE